ncbi:MAG: hypothetical protein EOO50_13060 [Flavobacterium sp.]|uniref:DUF6624 domain-containing protein n=1 Tax=Flavobacterium sp. TaxID=239 RepID=UPI0012241D3C|nr:DUF6624 domain-containing protein [Flavobacterium sp.]RZJ65577.1 MAG: hypothetical protein EOO50_13060 [Flavobacterium sp.]
MNRFPIFAFCMCATFTLAQPKSSTYSTLVKKADSLYEAKSFRESAVAYSEAFALKTKSISSDRYNAACSWALANIPDSAFVQLDKIISDGFTDSFHASTDADMANLKNDVRWQNFLENARRNGEISKAKINWPLVEKLERIHSEDQRYRKLISSVETKYGKNSPEIDALWERIKKTDSINLIEVTKIIDEFGWPSRESVRGSSALFLVIQHADRKTHEKYLPIMRDAVKKGNAEASSLALLEDRTALENGRKQIYGSQIGTNSETQKNYLRPLEDPENVDKRRESVGLEPLKIYLKGFGIDWDSKQYILDLPEIEAYENKQFKGK